MIGALLVKMKGRAGGVYLNSREIDKFLRDWRDDAVFVYPGSTPVSGIHQGKERIRQWWMTFYEQFPTSHFTTKGVYVKNILSFLLSNKMAIEWEVQVTNRGGDSFHNQGVSLVTVQNGKIVRFEDYIFDQETLERAWSPGT
jgi:ketosteroid isomerase-like protein